MTQHIDIEAFEERFAAYLSHLGDLDVAALTSVLTERTGAVGEVWTQQGKQHGSLMFIDDGGLDVTVANESEAPHTVAILGPGDVVGEVGLLSPGPATATVRVTKDAHAWVLDSRALDTLWEQHPPAASSLVQGLCHLMARRIRSVEGDLDTLQEHESGGLSGLLKRLFGRAA
jgi:CRP/FNR family cyclic AMP-dependent transcriptional regulator